MIWAVGAPVVPTAREDMGWSLEPRRPTWAAQRTHTKKKITLLSKQALLSVLEAQASGWVCFL